MTQVELNFLLNTPKYKEEKEYWLNKLAGELQERHLHLSIPPTQTQGNIRELHELEFPADLTSWLLHVSRNSDVSLYILLLTGLQCLQYRFTGDADLLVGSPVYQETRSEQTYNRLVLLRDQLSGEMTFKESLLSIRQTVLEAYKNQNYPLEYLGTSLPALPEDPLSLTNRICLLANIHDTSVVEECTQDLVFVFEKCGETLRGRVVFSTAVFDHRMVSELGKHYITILASASENMDIQLAYLDLLAVDQRETILGKFNDTRVEFPQEKSVVHFFEENVSKQPDQIAVIYQDQQITYQELNERTNQLAHYLQRKGIGREDRVGILMERSPEMMWSILAVWKTGGAYIPVDPLYPVERIIGILTDSGANCLLTFSGLVDSAVEEGFSGEIVRLDLLAESLEGEKTENINIPVEREQLAYVIYTSGSTGKPKGAMVEHVGMMNHMHAKVNELQISSLSRIAQNASHCFDISVWQFFVGLVTGGTTVIYPDALLLEPEQWIRAILKDRITILEVVPSFLAAMLDYLETTFVEFTTVESLMVTGEIVKKNLVERWFQLYPEIPMVNAYGPTEASDDITHFRMEQVPELEDIPIGKPVQNFSIYIVDQHMQLVPIGVKGEICVAGIGVGRGYLHDPDRTRLAFMEDPFREDRMRLYKTGDLGCWLPDGNIRFFGRKDHQVKIRGFRIELGEIENKLVNHPQIKEAVVLDKEDQTGAKYLTGFLVTEGKLLLTEVQAYLAERLPDYMIPSQILFLDHLPLLANGKVDRKTLQKMEFIQVKANEISQPPRNQIEEKLVTAWQDLLGVSRVGIDDNFFALGGDSIKAIQVATRLQRAGFKLAVRDLFAYPVIRELSHYVKELDYTVNQEVVQGSFSLTPVQEWFFAQNFAEMHHWNQSVMLYSKTGFAEQSVQTIFTKIVEHHDLLRATFLGIGKELDPMIRETDSTLFTLDVLDLCDEADYAEKISKEADQIQQSIDLAKGPLVKLGLFKTREGDHLLIVIHHLVMDGVSWRILLEDFALGMTQLAAGEELIFQEKTHSYQEWAEKLREYASSRKLLREIPYWSKLELMKSGTLPKDQVVDQRVMQNANSFSISIGKDETEQLLTKVHEAYHTEITDLLLTALGYAFREWMQEDTLLIQLEGHGREDLFETLDITRTIGWFTAEYPVLLDLSKADNLSLQIRTIKEDLRRIPEKGVGYGILKYVTPAEHKTELQFSLHPEVSFNYFGQVDQDVETEFFTLSTLPTGKPVSDRAKKIFAIDINAMIRQGELHVNCNYDQTEYRRQTMESLMENFRNKLSLLIDHCLHKEESEVTPADLGYSQLSIEGLEKIKGLLAGLK